jgi:ATP-dependent DNA helicase RecG
MDKQKSLEITLDTPVQYVKGVGPQRAQLLKKLDILTVYDLLYFAPRRYEDRTQIKKISQLTPNSNCTVKGYVILIGPRKMIGKEGASVILEDESGWVEIFWTVPEIAKRFNIGDEVVVSGRVYQDKYSGRMVFIHPEYAIIGKKGIEELIGGSIVPIYPQTENLDTRLLRQLIYNALNDERLVIEETLPSFIREKYGLYPRKEALKKLHFPETFEEAYRARETLVFEEAFYFFLKKN